jgi:antitoxin VapB
MALSIKHPDADRLARELAELTGESLTETVVRSLRERLLRQEGRATSPPLTETLRALRKKWAALPVFDERSADEILGYDDRGLPS